MQTAPIVDREWFELRVQLEEGLDVAAGLARLPVTHRAALELKSLGHTQQEIADVLEVTPSHAGVLVYRARQALAAYLAPFVGEAAS